MLKLCKLEANLPLKEFDYPAPATNICFSCLTDTYLENKRPESQNMNIPFENTMHLEFLLSIVGNQREFDVFFKLKKHTED
jgi:hypothetical protein